jgi:hypothetical protein
MDLSGPTFKQIPRKKREVGYRDIGEFSGMVTLYPPIPLDFFPIRIKTGYYELADSRIKRNGAANQFKVPRFPWQKPVFRACFSKVHVIYMESNTLDVQGQIAEVGHRGPYFLKGAAFRLEIPTPPLRFEIVIHDPSRPIEFLFSFIDDPPEMFHP